MPVLTIVVLKCTSHLKIQSLRHTPNTNDQCMMCTLEDAVDIIRRKLGRVWHYTAPSILIHYCFTWKMILEYDSMMKWFDTWIMIYYRESWVIFSLFSGSRFVSNVIFLLVIWEFHTMYPYQTHFPFQVHPCVPHEKRKKKYTKYDLCCPYTPWYIVKASPQKTTESFPTLHTHPETTSCEQSLLQLLTTLQRRPV